MKNGSWSAFLRAWILFGIGTFVTSCLPTDGTEQLAYSNDFSNLDLAGFENAKLFVFQNDTVVGFYHNDEVAVTVPDLPSHNYLKITVDVLIHDSWDGNSPDGVGGPDYWYMGFDGTEILRTTFSNTPCESTYCLYQSYPDDYPRQNVPKTGAISTNMPGLCLFGAYPNYTTRYSITKLVEHTNPSVKIFMGGDLTAVGAPDPICDESWSIAKVEVVAIQTN